MCSAALSDSSRKGTVHMDDIEQKSIYSIFLRLEAKKEPRTAKLHEVTVILNVMKN